MLPTIVDTLGWTLLHFLWQGLILWGLCALLMLILRPAAAAVRYWVGMVVLATMGAAPILTFVTLMDAADIVPIGTSTSLHAVAGAVGGWSSLAGWVETILPWTVAAWVIGVFLQSSRLALECLRIRRVALRSIAPLAPDWQRIADHLRASLGVRQAVGIMTSAGVAVPMVVGWVRPLILIPPSAMLGLTARQLELIISHELAHVKRLDYALNGLQILVETLLFYHPGVRAVSSWIREEREHCCDDIVVRLSGDRLGYARALTEVAGLRCSAGMQVAVAATGGRLLGRVRRLVAMPGPQRGSAYWMTGLVIVAVLAAGSMRQLSILDGTVAVMPAARKAPAHAPAVAGSAAFPSSTVAIEYPARMSPSLPATPAASDTSGPSRTSARRAAAPAPDVPAVPVTDAAPPPEPVSASGGDAQAASEIASGPAPSSADAAIGPRRGGGSSPTAAQMRDADRLSSLAPGAEMELQPARPINAADLLLVMAPSAPVAAAAPVRPAAAPRSGAVPTPMPPATDVSAPPAAVPQDSIPQLRAAPVAAPQKIVLPLPPAPVVSGGELLEYIAPDYPRRARVKGIEGSVRVRYAVDKRGRVSDIRVLSSRQGRYFERAVREALQHWRYQPFAIDGEPIRRMVERSFDFGLAQPQPQAVAWTGPCQKVTGTRICRSERGYEDLALTVVGTTP
jgi:TonB family protein